MSDQNYVKGITFSPTVTPAAGKERLESDGTNLYFNGNLLGTSGNVFDVITTNIITTKDSAYGNVLVTSNLALLPYTGTIGTSESATSGLQTPDGVKLFFCGQELANVNTAGLTANTFPNGLQSNIIAPYGAFGSEILLQSNLQVEGLLWANNSTFGLTTTQNLLFDKSFPSIKSNTGSLVISSDNGDTGILVSSRTEASPSSNIAMTCNDTTNTEDSGKSSINFSSYDPSSFGQPGIAQIAAQQEQNISFSGGGGGKLIFKTRDPKPGVLGPYNDQIDMMTIRTSNSASTGNTISFGGAVDSNVRVSVNRGLSSNLTFDVGNLSQTYFSVDTNDSNVNIGDNVKLNFNGPIDIRQIGSNIRIGTNPVVFASDAIAIGKDAGGANEKSVSIGIEAGQTNQSGNCVAIGYRSGNDTQDKNAIAIGLRAGRTSQSKACIAIGRDAANSNQSDDCVAIGTRAGMSTQGSESVSIGYQAGQSNQGVKSVAIGNEAGNNTQGDSSIAIGSEAGDDDQGDSSIAIGNQTGKKLQGDFCIAIGDNAGNFTQSDVCVAIGYQAGQSFQTSNAVAVGYQAGQSNQGSAAFAIGYQSGLSNQGSFATAIGPQSGQLSQNSFSVAIGYQAGKSYQAENCVAIGYEAGFENQNPQSFAVGYRAGFENQQSNAIALGYQSGQTSQGSQATSIGGFSGQSLQGNNAMAIGFEAGKLSQNAFSLAIGAFAGNSTQSQDSLAIGYEAGFQIQKTQSLAIGNYAGMYTQNSAAIAIGYKAGQFGQKTGATAIGNLTGQNNQGSYAFAAGYKAGETAQHDNSIILNASGAALNSDGADRCFIKPIRGVAHGLGVGVLKYDPVTSEVTYSTS